MSWVPIEDALAVPRQTHRRAGIGKRHPLQIYALIDPQDRCIRYIGVTSRELTERLKLHLEKPTNAGMRAWFGELREMRIRPEAVKLEWVSYDEWEAAERGWIYWCRERGSLLNVDQGGRARTARGSLRTFTPGEYQRPVGGEHAVRPPKKVCQDGPQSSGGGAKGRGPRTECRPRLVPVAVGVFRRARG